jgi:tetratricopeptide (TPR) repeat protein
MFSRIFELLKIAFKFPDFNTFQKLFDYISKVSVKAFYTAISFLVFYIFISSLLSSNFTMNPFSIPDSFSKDGYSGEIFSREIMDRFNEITRETIDLKKEDKEDAGSNEFVNKKDTKKDTTAAKNELISDINAINFSNGLENLDVEVLGLGLSVGKLSEYIRVLLGVEVKKISGELVRKDDTYILNMRLTGFPPLTFKADTIGTDYEKIKYLREQAALALKKYFSPLELAFYLYKNENYENAIEAAEYVIDKNIGNKHWAYYIIAQSKIEQDDDYELSTLDYFDKATKEYDGFVEAWYNWGYYLHEKRMYNKAVEKFEKVISIDEKHSNALVYWGNSLFQLDKFDEAAEKHKAALIHNPDNEYAQYRLGFDLLYMGEYLEAIPYYQKAIELYPSETNNYMDLAECFFHIGDTARALSTYVDAKNAVGSYKKQQELYKYWSVMSLLAGRKQEAISIMSQHLSWEDKIDDYEADEILFDIHVELSIEKNYNQKIDFYKKSINEGNYKSYYFTSLAYVYSSIGNYDSAIYYYNDFYKKYTSKRSYYDEMGDNYMAKGDFDEAALHYEKDIDFKGESIYSLASLGLALYRNGEIMKAKEKFIQARNYSIYTTAAVYHGLALVSEALNENDIALSYYYQAIDKEEEEPLVIMEYAALLDKESRQEDADSIMQYLYSIEGFDSRPVARQIYMERGLKVALKYYNKLIEVGEVKGRFYTLLAYVYALDGNDDAFFEQMKKAKASGYPIKTQMRYFPYNKKAYATQMVTIISG